jgi:serine protease Do
MKNILLKYKYLLSLLVIFFNYQVHSYPAQSELFGLSESMVHVWVTYGNGVTGTGSGVVIKENHVATDCHVFADAEGVNVVKTFKKYVPIAVYADWKNDLCILQFDDLPLPPVKMVMSDQVQYESKVFALTFPNDSPIPLPSYGKVKGVHPFKDSNIIRTSAAFTVGSSGGALFDLDFNLIGITTFKSPGKRLGYFYCLPTEWITALLEKTPQLDLVSKFPPFWSLPDDEKPFFMQVIMPMQQDDWGKVKRIADEWIRADNKHSDAWYFLGLAELKMQNYSKAVNNLKKAFTLNDRHLDSLVELYKIANIQEDQQSTDWAIEKMNVINPDFVDYELQNSL